MSTPVIILDGRPQQLGADATRSAWNDLSVPLTQSKQGASLKPDYDFTNVGYLFPQNDATEILYMTVQMPHFWKEGSRIYPHVHWNQSANQSPVFKIDYRWFNVGDAVPATWTTFVMDQLAISYTSGMIHQINEGTGGIDGTGFTLSSALQIKLYRDDNVYTGDVLTTMFDIHIEVDGFGSELEFNKVAP